MPELPEVEAARRVLDAVVRGQRLVDVDVRDDDIVFGRTAPEVIRARLTGATVVATGRRGKYFWLELEGGPMLGLHLGMSGGLMETTPGQTSAPQFYRVQHDAEREGGPRFLKLALTTAERRTVAFADGRRLGRIWLAESPGQCERMARLGPDAWQELPALPEFAAQVQRRKAPIKALLMDQKFLAGIGNYLADEILYAAGVAPARTGASLTTEEAERVHHAIGRIIEQAVSVNAVSSEFPAEWLFHVRWGGAKGAATTVDGEPIVRETVGGRTTAWVPSRQR